MAKRTNVTINGKDYYRIRKKTGRKILNKKGILVDEVKTIYGESKRDAEKKFIEYLDSLKEDPIEKRSTRDVIDEWINTVFMKSDLAESTKDRYIQAYRAHFRSEPISATPLNELSALRLQTFYNECGKKTSSLRALNKLLKRFFKYVKATDIGKDIMDTIVVPADAKDESLEQNEVDVWDDNDLRAVITALDGTTLRFLVVLAVNSGARISELLALTYDDIQDGNLIINKQTSEYNIKEHGGIHLSKTKTKSSNRIIPLSEYVMTELKRHKIVHKEEMLRNGYRTNLIFSSDTGQYHYKSNIRMSLKRLYARIGVPYHRFHSFRHTFGTNLSRAGVRIEETSRLMGHTDISITMQYYINIDSKRKREAVEKIAGFSIA